MSKAENIRNTTKNNMRKLIGSGLSGLVGSRVTELLKNTYEFEYVDRACGIDIQNREKVIDVITGSDADIVLHLAAKTDVDGCEGDKVKSEKGEAWKINVLGTQNIAEAVQRSEKKLIYISTDFVFDGEKTLDEVYTEDDIPNPINWYGKTKYEAELIVSALDSPWLILRIAYPYRANFQRNDFVRTMLLRLKKGEQVSAITDHIFTPTFIDDITRALDLLIQNNSTGIFHIVGSQALTPFDAANYIAKAFGLKTSLIQKTTRKEFFRNRTPRPYNLSLSNSKISKLGITMKSFEEGLLEIKRQVYTFRW